jgi:hypothetical protein
VGEAAQIAHLSTLLISVVHFIIVPMSKHIRKDQISVRLPEPLRAALEEQAKAEGSRITTHIRKIRIEHEVARLAKPSDSEAA